jgi:hypothetical protein
MTRILFRVSVRCALTHTHTHTHTQNWQVRFSSQKSNKQYRILRDWQILVHFGNITWLANTCVFRQHYATGKYLCISATLRDWQILVHFGNITRLANTCAFRQHYVTGKYLCISATLGDSHRGLSFQTDRRVASSPRRSRDRSPFSLYRGVC